MPIDRKKVKPGGSMTQRVRLPMIVLGRSMAAPPATEENPTIRFELEAETGEILDVEFSLRGIMSTISLARGWPLLREELAQLNPPTYL
jgi:hypothetical protein